MPKKDISFFPDCSLLLCARVRFMWMVYLRFECMVRGEEFWSEEKERKHLEDDDELMMMMMIIIITTTTRDGMNNNTYT